MAVSGPPAGINKTKKEDVSTLQATFFTKIDDNNIHIYIVSIISIIALYLKILPHHMQETNTI